MRGNRTSGLGNLTRKGTLLRTFWSVDSASTKSRCFWEGPEGNGWKSEERSKLVHLLSARASTCSQDPLSKNSLHALERPWRFQILNLPPEPGASSRLRNYTEPCLCLPASRTRHTRCISETFSTTIFSLTLDLVSSLFVLIVLQTSKY